MEMYFSFRKLLNMNISNDFIRAYTGGVFLFRFVCFERGPDYYYLFKSKILDIAIDETGLWVDTIPFYPNRFTCNEWVDHETSEGVRLFKSHTMTLLEKDTTYPTFKIISPEIILVGIDMSAEVVIYANECDLPDETSIFQDFPDGYEKLGVLFSSIF